MARKKYQYSFAKTIPGYTVKPYTDTQPIYDYHVFSDLSMDNTTVHQLVSEIAANCGAYTITER